MSAAAALATKRTVLIVEDDADVRSSLSEQLQDAGYGVEVADDGEIAWNRLKSGVHPDLVVLDLKLPKV